VDGWFGVFGFVVGCFFVWGGFFWFGSCVLFFGVCVFFGVGFWGFWFWGWGGFASPMTLTAKVWY